jgi:hypothetical protein
MRMSQIIMSTAYQGYLFPFYSQKIQVIIRIYEFIRMLRIVIKFIFNSYHSYTKFALICIIS